MWTLGSEVEGDTPVQRWEEEDREGDVRPNVSGRGKNGVGLEQETGVGGGHGRRGWTGAVRRWLSGRHGRGVTG